MIVTAEVHTILVLIGDGEHKALRTSISVMSLAMVDPRIKEQRARKRFMIVVLELKKEVFEYKWTALSVEARIRKEASDCM